jgi:hypothetical protein
MLNSDIRRAYRWGCCEPAFGRGVPVLQQIEAMTLVVSRAGKRLYPLIQKIRPTSTDFDVVAKGEYRLPRPVFQWHDEIRKTRPARSVNFA